MGAYKEMFLYEIILRRVECFGWHLLNGGFWPQKLIHGRDWRTWIPLISLSLLIHRL